MPTMAFDNLSCLEVHIDSGIAWLSLNHPPINLLDDDMARELDHVTRTLENEQSVRVVVLQSKLPKFFIAHSGLARVASSSSTDVSTTPNFRLTQILTERLRNMPKVTIAKVEGIARGGGNEIVLGADMCFAALEQSVFGQPEIGVGIVPGGGSTQRLPALVGRARSLEILLGGEDFSAEMAERYGWINRAMKSEDLGPFVERLARRIASFLPHTVGHIKAAVNQGAFSWLPGGLLAEARQADLCVTNETTQVRVKEGLRLGMETYDGELDLSAIIAQLG